MKIVKINQVEHEQKAWERSLQFLKQENALLKYRLSEMVDMSEGNGFLQLAEYFQNELLLKDAILEKLIKKLHHISETFEKMPATEKISENLLLKQQEFRNEILNLENDFIYLSKEFNEKISQNI